MWSQNQISFIMFRVENVNPRHAPSCLHEVRVTLGELIFHLFLQTHSGIGGKKGYLQKVGWKSLTQDDRTDDLYVVLEKLSPCSKLQHSAP